METSGEKSRLWRPCFPQGTEFIAQPEEDQ